METNNLISFIFLKQQALDACKVVLPGAADPYRAKRLLFSRISNGSRPTTGLDGYYLTPFDPNLSYHLFVALDKWYQ